MARRPLSPDERALWQRVAATATPLHKREGRFAHADSGHPEPVTEEKSFFVTRGTGQGAKPLKTPSPGAGERFSSFASPARHVPPSPPRVPARSGAAIRHSLTHAHLDARWDRRLRRGEVEPDLSIDLHGHTLTSAHTLVDATLARAVARNARVILIVAGRDRSREASTHPLPHEGRPRGAIRAALSGWLAASDHAGHLLALRPAHKRHGGAGAVYLVLKR